jgi:hypothetical protein
MFTLVKTHDYPDNLGTFCKLPPIRNHSPKPEKPFSDLLVIRVLEMIGDIFPDALTGTYAVPR